MRELVQSAIGCTDELRVVASAGGHLRGGVAMFRDARSTPYREVDVEFVSSLFGPLARGGCESAYWPGWQQNHPRPRPAADRP